MFKKILILYILLQFNSLFAQEPEKPDYFPLQIGNKWVYRDFNTPGSEYTKIVDTLIFYNKKYYKFLYHSAERDYNTFSYYRKDTLNLVWHTDSLDSLKDDDLLFKLDAHLGETWFPYHDSSTVTTLADTNYEIYSDIGPLTNCYFFSSYGPYFVSYANVLAPNIGLVNSSGENDEIIFKGAYVNGIVYGDTTSVQTTIENQMIKPQSCTLDQNYPNPFNSNTEIKYTLQNNSHVQLLIYNLQGQPVRTLASGYCRPGEYTAHWNGCDESGAPLASGIYFYRLMIDGQVATTKRLVMVK